MLRHRVQRPGDLAVIVTVHHLDPGEDRLVAGLWQRQRIAGLQFGRTFAIEAARAGLPVIRLHDLRHTWATLALSVGEHPKVVQERLGHANVSITLDIYSHAEGLHSAAADRVAGIIFDTS
jgi:integrase